MLENINSIFELNLFSNYENNSFFDNNILSPSENNSFLNINSNFSNLLNKNLNIFPSMIEQKEVVIEITNTSKKNSSRNSQYNILRKIQIHFLNFIIQFLNDILKAEKINAKFFSLTSDFKYIINNKYSEELKQQKISDIINHNISKKFRKYKPDENLKTLNEIEVKNNEVLKKIFSINYLTLFKRIYYKSNKKINLKEFGINKIYNLSKKVKMFKDLLNDNEKKGKNYIKNIQICVKKNYIPEIIIFICEN
jgi:hypothetical protein